MSIANEPILAAFCEELHERFPEITDNLRLRSVQVKAMKVVTGMAYLATREAAHWDNHDVSM
jgi:hypothetical protein